MQGIKLDWIAVLKYERTIREDSPIDTGEDPCIINFGKVLEVEKTGELQSFFLHTLDHKWSVGVHLKSGEFMLGNYVIHPAPEIAELNPNYRIVNVRRKARDLHEETKEWLGDAFLVKYILGWQCTIDGDNYQRLMFIDPATLRIEFRSKR